VHESLVGVDGGIGDFAFNRHHAVIAQSNNDIGARAREACFTTKFAGIGRGREHRDFTHGNLGETGACEQVFNGLLLRLLRCAPAMRLDLARCGHRCGRYYGRAAFFLGGLAIVSHPREAMGIKDGEDGITDACCLRKIDANP